MISQIIDLNQFRTICQVRIMAFKINWSAFFEVQSDEIYEYYEKHASLRVATKIVNEIIQESEKLIKASFIGHQEQLLKERKTQYRYLVTRDIKLIYSVDEKTNLLKLLNFSILVKIHLYWKGRYKASFQLCI